jgi:hypothetical protein
MIAVWSDQFSRALCQTVPSPFGGGSSDPEVASCCLHSLSLHATPSGKVCRRRVRRGALAPDHAQLTAATSVELQSCPPNRPCQAGEPRLSCAWFFTLAGRDACITRNSMGNASRSLSPAKMACHGIGPGHGEDDSGGMLGVPGRSCRGERLFGVHPLRAAGSRLHPVRSLPQRQHVCAPSMGLARLYGALMIARARVLQHADDLRQH